MAGVAGPMAERDKRAAARFLSGLAMGELLSSLLVALAVIGVGSAIALVLPWSARVLSTGLVVVALGIADTRNRTPHVWRQVPKLLMHKLPAGRLGLSWGFDLGLLFTTQKTTSILWATLAVLLLISPVSALWVIPALALVSVLAVAIRTSTWSMIAPDRWGRRRARWTRLARIGSGYLLLVLGGLTLAGAL